MLFIIIDSKICISYLPITSFSREYSSPRTTLPPDAIVRDGSAVVSRGRRTATTGFPRQATRPSHPFLDLFGSLNDPKPTNKCTVGVGMNEYKGRDDDVDEEEDEEYLYGEIWGEVWSDREMIRNEGEGDRNGNRGVYDIRGDKFSRNKRPVIRGVVYTEEQELYERQEHGKGTEGVGYWGIEGTRLSQFLELDPYWGFGTGSAGSHTPIALLRGLPPWGGLPLGSMMSKSN